MIRFFRHLAVKVVMIIMLLFSFLVVDTKNKVEAFAPLVPVMGAVGMYIAKEIAFELGWKAGAEGVKYMTKKLAPVINKSIKNNEFDWVKSKPTKSGKKMRVPVSGKDVAKMAWHLSDLGEEVIQQSVTRTNHLGSYQGGIVTIDDVDPFYNTAINLKVERGPITKPGAFAFPDYIAMSYDMTIKPLAYQGKSELKLSSIFNTSHVSVALPGGDYTMYYIDDTFNYYSSHIYIKDSNGEIVRNDYHNSNAAFGGRYDPFDWNARWAFDMYRRALSEANTKYFFANGLGVPENMQHVVKLPPNTPDVYNLPKKYDGKVIDIDLGFDFDLPDVDFDTNTLITHVVNQNDNIQNYIDRTMLRVDPQYTLISASNYTYVTNNNYYDSDAAADILKEVLPLLPKPPDDKPSTGEIIPVDPIPKLPIEIGVEVEGMKYCVNGDEVVPCKDIEAIDGSLLSMAKNSYTYATDTIKTGVEGIQSLGSSAAEMTKLFDTFFGWLPSEIRVLMVGGFSLVIGIGLFRAFRR